jgi:flagellar hook protein FlgE
MEFTNKTPYVAPPTETPGAWKYTITDLSDSTTVPSTGDVSFASGAYAPTTFPFTYKENGVNKTSTLKFTNPAAPGDPTYIATSDPTYTAGGTVGTLKITSNSGSDPMEITMKYDALTQYGGESTVRGTNGDGYAAGTLDLAKLTIDQSGVIIGGFTNGRSKNLGQVAMAVFNNPGGLTKVGANQYSKSNNSGDPQVGAAGSGGRGTFTAGTLEMSNVDLAQQFSDMIITQRGFQSNSKIITTDDEMLEILANLKR